MTYTIQRYNDVGLDVPVTLRFFGKYFSAIAKPLIFNWSVTQYDTIAQQLNGGIRYLDFRLATKRDNKIYFLHGLYGDEITSHLLEISNWLSRHPNELIIIDCQHFYSFTEEHHRGLVQKLKSIFGNKICPCRTTDLCKITLDWLNRRKFQIIVVYRNEIVRLETDMWPSGLWPTPWPNTVYPQELIDFLDLRLKTRLPYTGFVSQCLLTPDTSYVLKHLCGSLHRDLATLCRDTSLPWIEEHFPGAGGLNVVIGDFVSYNNFLFSRIVIQRNIRLFEDEDYCSRMGVYMKEKKGSGQSLPKV